MKLNKFVKFVEEKTKTLKIGVVGYSTSNFDPDKALNLIKKAFNKLEKDYPNKKFDVVSGLTDVGIPALAYEEATKRHWKTTGIACKRAKEYDLFPVDKKIIVGTEWGDESKTFLKYIDVLIAVGGGEQSKAEIKAAKEMKIPVAEYELGYY